MVGLYHFSTGNQEKFCLDIPLKIDYAGIVMKLFGTESELRFEEIRSDHLKRHGSKCTEGNCHTQWLISRLDDLERRIGNATFLLEMHRL